MPADGSMLGLHLCEEPLAQPALTSAALTGPLEHIILPYLGARDLVSLACTSLQLRQSVASASLTTWQRAASTVLPPRHPGLTSSTIAALRDTLHTYTVAQRHVVEGIATQQNFTELTRPHFSPTDDVIAFQDEADPCVLRLLPASPGPPSISDHPSITLPGRIVGYQWRPDGTSIAVLHRIPGTPGLTVIDVEQHHGWPHSMTISSTVRIDDRAMHLPAGFIWSPCATMIVLRSTADRSHTAVFDVAVGRVILASTGGWLEAVWRPDSGAIAFQSASSKCSQKSSVTVLAIPSGKLLAQVASDVAQYPVEFSPDGNLLALRNAGTGHIDIVAASTGALVSAFNGMAEVAWSPDSQSLMGPTTDMDDCLFVVNAATGQQIGSIMLSGQDVFEMSRAWSPNSKLISIATADETPSLSVFEAPNCQELCRFRWSWQADPGPVYTGRVEWHNDGTRVLVHTPKSRSLVRLISF